MKFRKLSGAEIRRLTNNKGDRLTSVYGCSDLMARKGEKILSRKDISADNSAPSIAAGYIGTRVETSERVLKIINFYHEGRIEVWESGA